MIRRSSAFVLVSFAAVVALAVPAAGHVEIEPAEAVAGATTTFGEPTTTTTAATTTTNDLPDTTLEADERDDGSTSAAPWIIGAGIAAIAAIAVGGTLLKRTQDRENDQGAAIPPDPEQ